MSKTGRATFAFRATIFVALIGAVLWIIGLIGLSTTGPLGTVPSTHQVLFACSGLFATIFVAFAGIIHSATLTKNSPDLH